MKKRLFWNCHSFSDSARTKLSVNVSILWRLMNVHACAKEKATELWGIQSLENRKSRAELLLFCWDVYAS